MVDKKKKKKKKRKVIGYDPVKPIWIVGLILCFGIGVYVFTTGTYRRSSYDNIQYIKSFMSGSGEIHDISNKLNMKNPEEDIIWFDDGKEVRIEFGRIVMEWDRDEFLSETVQSQLSVIGFEIKQEDNKPDSPIRLFYQGLELPEQTY